MPRPQRTRKTSSARDCSGHCGMKHRIMAAALRLMSSKGIEKTSVQDIVRAVNVTKPVLYYYFKNKEDLCNQLISEGVRMMQGYMSRSHRSDKPVKGFLSNLFAEDNRCFIEHPEMAKIVLKDITSDMDDEFHSLIRNMRDTRRATIHRILRTICPPGTMGREKAAQLSHVVAAVSLYVLVNSQDGTVVTNKFTGEMAELLAELAETPAHRSEKK